jgi:polysaccharide biosynthesis/export protein
METRRTTPAGRTGVGLVRAVRCIRRKVGQLNFFMRRILWISLALSCGSLLVTVQAQTAPAGELVQYIRDARKAGLKVDAIKKNALAAGWAQAMVDEAVEAVDKGQPAPTKSAKVNQEKAEPEHEAPKTPATAPAVSPSFEIKPEAAPPVGTPATPPAETPTGTPAGNPARPIAPVTSPASAIDRTMRDTYQIGEGDVLQISVWGEAAASVPSGVVRPDGMISMPLIKDIRVAGFTPAEAEKAITEQLSKLIKTADVTVIVSQINSKKIFVVGGGVKKEGPISFTYRMTVMQAISEAGGLTDYAKRKKIYVLRNENGRQYKLAFDYDAVLRGERTELNIPLQAGDTLVVPNH